MKDRRTYEIMRAEEVGAPWNPLVLGKHSGRHAVQRRCKDLGLEVEGGELVEVYRALMTIADERKTITDNDVVAVVSAVRTGSVRHDNVDPFDTPSGVAAAHQGSDERNVSRGLVAGQPFCEPEPRAGEQRGPEQDRHVSIGLRNRGRVCRGLESLRRFRREGRRHRSEQWDRCGVYDADDEWFEQQGVLVVSAEK